MKTITLRHSFSLLQIIALLAIIFLHVVVGVLIYYLTPGLGIKHLLLLLGSTAFCSIIVLLFVFNTFSKNYIKPIATLSSSLKNQHVLSNNKSNIAEYSNIIDAIHISNKQISHHNKILESKTEKDALTGLANRVAFNQKFEQTVNLNNQYQDSYALILININDFKNINYSHNQKVGDLILKTVAKSLVDNIVQTEIIARTGNDEFAIIIGDANIKKVDTVCLKIARLLNKNYKIASQRLRITTRIGATLYNPNEYHSDDYFNQAADAAKAAFSQQLPYELFKQDKSAYNSRRIEISQSIAKFSRENNLGLYIRYQPKINLSTGEITGLEALTRLNHPELGRIRPDEFIQIAEDENFISKITDYILEECIKQMSLWNKAGKGIQVAVNVSPRDLLDIDFPNRLMLLLKKYELPAHLLELEVTENVVIEDSRITNIVLNRIKKLGVGLAIDDFGVGYSGFNNLRSLPFSTLKIDKSFVIGMMNNEEDEIIVTTTIQVAHKLGMKVVAEGIDNIEVAFALTERYCDIGQGFLYSRPVSPEIIESEYLRNKKSFA